MTLRWMAALAVSFASVAALPGVAVAETAEELLAKNLQARGGAEKLAAIKTIRFNGRLVFPGGFELTYTETRSRTNDALRLDATVQGMTLVQAYDGKQGWRINPFEGRRDAERMSGDEARSLADSASIDGALLAAKAKGSKVSYLGTEEMDGTQAHKLKVTETDGDEFVYFLDPDTYLEIFIDEIRRVRGAEQASRTELGDYEQVNGVYFPYSIASGPKDASPSQRQVVAIEKAEANVDIDAAMFAMPGTAQTK